ncbi:MAG: hypothetical protein JSR11_03830 [Bacteroidetes bacterium]|nr:hypothetical protein [Bacteroidota bacterium]
MKKIFSSLLFAVMVMTGFAQVKQDTSQHLTFKGVPLDGTLNEYVSKMKKSGFIHLSTTDGTAILNGDFAGYKDCHVGVSTLKQKDLVYKIAVIFPNKDTWSTLSGNYFDLKNMLTEKYGKPSEVVEKFDGYSQPREDDDKMYKVKFDNCKYYAIWETDKGDIQLSIAHNSVTSCFVTLAYFDKINGNIIKSSAKDDL